MGISSSNSSIRLSVGPFATKNLTLTISSDILKTEHLCFRDKLFPLISLCDPDLRSSSRSNCCWCEVKICIQLLPCVNVLEGTCMSFVNLITTSEWMLRSINVTLSLFDVLLHRVLNYNYNWELQSRTTYHHSLSFPKTFLLIFSISIFDSFDVIHSHLKSNCAKY